jgi:hypothetical protein
MQVADSRKSVGAVWFLLIAIVLCLSVFFSYRMAGPAWDKYGEDAEFREIATGLALVLVVYLYRYFFFSANMPEKTRNSRALKWFFLISVIVVATRVIFVYRFAHDYSYNASAYNLYGVYLLATVGLMVPYGVEICWAVIGYQRRRVNELCGRKKEGLSVEELLPRCYEERKKINSDCLKLMYGIMTVAVFVLFVSREAYFAHSKVFHILFLLALIIICVYPSLKIIRMLSSIKKEEIKILEKQIFLMDAKILAKNKEGEAVDELESQRLSLEESKNY